MLPDNKLPIVSVANPVINPKIGPYIHPIIISGVHETDIEKLKTGT